MTKLYCAFSDGSYSRRDHIGTGGIIVSCDATTNNGLPDYTNVKIEHMLAEKHVGQYGSFHSEFIAAARTLDQIPANSNVILHCDPMDIVTLIKSNNLDTYAQTCKIQHKDVVERLSAAVRRHKSVIACHRSDNRNQLIRACHHFARAADQGDTLRFQLPLYVPINKNTNIIFSQFNKRDHNKKKKKQQRPIAQRIKQDARKQIQARNIDINNLNPENMRQTQQALQEISCHLLKKYTGYKIKMSLRTNKNETDWVSISVHQRKTTKPQAREHIAARHCLNNTTAEDAISGLIEAKEVASWLQQALQ